MIDLLELFKMPPEDVRSFLNALLAAKKYRGSVFSWEWFQCTGNISQNVSVANVQEYFYPQFPDFGSLSFLKETAFVTDPQFSIVKSSFLFGTVRLTHRVQCGGINSSPSGCSMVFGIVQPDCGGTFQSLRPMRVFQGVEDSTVEVVELNNIFFNAFYASGGVATFDGGFTQYADVDFMGIKINVR